MRSLLLYCCKLQAKLNDSQSLWLWHFFLYPEKWCRCITYCYDFNAYANESFYGEALNSSESYESCWTFMSCWSINCPIIIVIIIIINLFVRNPFLWNTQFWQKLRLCQTRSLLKKLGCIADFFILVVLFINFLWIIRSLQTMSHLPTIESSLKLWLIVMICRPSPGSRANRTTTLFRFRGVWRGFESHHRRQIFIYQNHIYRMLGNAPKSWIVKVNRQILH